MELAALIISILGLLATGAVGVYLYKRTKSTTQDMKDFLVTLVVNAAQNPEALQKLLDDNLKTGSWRGKMKRDATGQYDIAWDTQVIQPDSTPLTVEVGKPTITQGKPKEYSDKKETKS